MSRAGRLLQRLIPRRFAPFRQHLHPLRETVPSWSRSIRRSVA